MAGDAVELDVLTLHGGSGLPDLPSIPDIVPRSGMSLEIIKLVQNINLNIEKIVLMLDSLRIGICYL